MQSETLVAYVTKLRELLHDHMSSLQLEFHLDKIMKRIRLYSCVIDLFSNCASAQDFEPVGISDDVWNLKAFEPVMHVRQPIQSWLDEDRGNIVFIVQYKAGMFASVMTAESGLYDYKKLNLCVRCHDGHAKLS